MVYFKHEFRDFTKTDYMAYAGVSKLPDGMIPKIFHVETNDEVSLDIILSGDGAGSTIISVESEIGSYLISLPGYNLCHAVIADSIVDYIKDYEVTKEAIDGIVSDYQMQSF